MRVENSTFPQEVRFEPANAGLSYDKLALSSLKGGSSDEFWLLRPVTYLWNTLRKFSVWVFSFFCRKTFNQRLFSQIITGDGIRYKVGDTDGEVKASSSIAEIEDITLSSVQLDLLPDILREIQKKNSPVGLRVKNAYFLYQIWQTGCINEESIREKVIQLNFDKKDTFIEDVKAAHSGLLGKKQRELGESDQEILCAFQRDLVDALIASNMEADGSDDRSLHGAVSASDSDILRDIPINVICRQIVVLQKVLGGELDIDLMIRKATQGSLQRQIYEAIKGGESSFAAAARRLDSEDNCFSVKVSVLFSLLKAAGIEPKPSWKMQKVDGVVIKVQ